MHKCTPALQAPATVEVGMKQLRSFAEGWLLHGEIAGWAPRTISDRRSWIERFCAHLEDRGHCFTVDSLRAFFIALQRGLDDRSRKPLRPASVKHVHSLVTAFASWCVMEGLLTASPMRRIPAPIVRDDKVRTFTDEEFRAILEAAKRSRNPRRDVAIVSMLADTGIRASELAEVRVEDLNLTSAVAVVRHGKGGKTRSVAFGKTTADALWRYLRDEHKEPTDPVFASVSGHAMNRGSLLKLVYRLGRVAGVRNVHVHRFRHDCAVRLLRNGAHVFGVMSQLGHSRVQTTQAYVHLAEVDVRQMQKAASPVDRLKKGGR